MIEIETIRKKIGKRWNWKDTRDYYGFDMSKTHSQEEANKEIDKHNQNVLKLFLSESDTNKVMEYFDCWKGIMYFTNDKEDKYDDKSRIIDFPGETTENILLWILNEGRLVWDGGWIKIQEESERQMEEYVNESMEMEEYEKESPARVVTSENRYAVLKRQKWRCNQCNCVLKYNLNSGWKGSVAHIDHIHPYSKRSSYPNGEYNINELSNLQALCPKCNLSKKDKLLH